MTSDAKDLSSAPGSGKDVPGVIAPPPFIYLGSIIVGVGLQVIWPLEVFPPVLEATLGGFFLLVAVIVFILSVREFRAAGTEIQTRRPTTVIIKSGPFRLSRNPIYLSFTLLHLGIGIWINSAWLIGVLILALVLVSYGVIEREERYLTQKFGDDYLQYKASVRRWL